MKEQLDFFRENGYLVVPDALSPDEVQTLNDAIDRDMVENPLTWYEKEDGHYQLSVHILLAQPAMDFTMRPPNLLPLLEAIMGPDLCADEHSVRIRRPNPDGETWCRWHRDATRQSRLTSESPPYLSVVYYLSDVDDTTHSFSVIPGTHRPDDLPPLETYDLSTAHHIAGAAGTAIFFDTELFHAGNVRQTPAERRTIHLYFGRTTDRYLSNFTIFPRRLWQGKDEATQKYYSRPNPITKLMLDRF